MNLKVTPFWLIIKHFSFSLQLPRKCNSYYRYPKENLSLVLSSATCLGDWSVFQIPFDFETKIGYTVVTAYAIVENVSSLHSQAK